jgi:hypothetical protein
VYIGAGGTGLFASPDSHYGEIWYELAGKRVMLRSAIEPVVLETIYGLAGIQAPGAVEVDRYPGYPFRGTIPVAPLMFFVAWPMLVLLAFWRMRRP